MTIAYSYQIKGARGIHRFGGRALLADEMGLGKSYQALLYASRHPECYPMVVVCPAGLKYNWEAEAAHHFGLRADVLDSMKPKERGLTTAPVTVVGYNQLEPWMDYLKSLKPGLVVLDECQALKSMSTQRTRYSRKLCKGVKRVVALSGTPLTSRPAEMFPVLNILRKDLFPAWRPYADRFCAPKVMPWGMDYSGSCRLPELHRILLDNLMIRRLKADVLKDLPPKRRFVVTLPISDPAEYRRAHKDFLGWLVKRKPEKLFKASKAPKLTQVGYLKRLTASLKMPAVFDWVDGFLEGSGQKLILFAVHSEVLDALEGRYKSISVRVDGSTKLKDRHRAKEAFQNGKPRLFLGNIEAAGKGLTLTAASTVAFVEMGWTPGEHVQAEDRPHRIGQLNTVDVVYLIAKGTIEERICRLIQSKKGVCDAVLDGGESGDEMEIYEDLCREMLLEEVAR